MALQPAAAAFPTSGEHESDLEAVARSILTNPDAEGEPDPQDSRQEPADEPDDLDPSQEGEEDDLGDDVDELDDNPQESDFDDEELDADDDEDGDEDDDLAADADEFFDVKVDGKVQQVTLEELKRDYSGSKRIAADIQVAKETTKDLALKMVEAEQRANTANQALQVAYNVAMEDAADPDIDWDALHEIDPTEWSHQRELQRAKQEKVQTKVAKIQQAVQAQSVEAEKAQDALKAQIAKREAQILRDAYPIFNDDAKGKERYKELVKFAVDRYGKHGLTPEILGEVQLAVPFILLNDIYEMEKGKTVAPKGKRRRVKRTVRPGTGTKADRSTTNKKRRERLEAKARETGHPNDVAALMFEPK